MTPPANTTPLGATHAGGFCAACGAALATGARFCHRCGTPAGQGLPITPAAATASGASNTKFTALPWAIAGVAVLALFANFAGKNFARAKGSAVDGSSNAISNPAIDGGGAAAPPSGMPGAPPNIENMTASERANRLYNRAMEADEAGKKDSATFFATMAVAAHGMIENMSLDERYHMGHAADLAGEVAVTQAQGDTILQQRPTHLLGLMLAARAARLRGDNAAAKGFDARFLAALQSELATKLPDYDVHRTEIDREAEEARRAK